MSKIEHHSHLGLTASFFLVCSVPQSCPTLCDPTDCSPPGSSVHKIFLTRILEWVAISSSRESPQPRDWTCVSCGSCIRSWILYHWACGEVLFVLSRTVSNSLCCSPVAHGTPSDLGARLPVLYLFAFSYCSWGSPGKNTGVGCHFLLPWTTFCQISSLRCLHLGWPAWAHGFIKLHRPLLPPQGCDPWGGEFC